MAFPAIWLILYNPQVFMVGITKLENQLISEISGAWLASLTNFCGLYKSPHDVLS